jgi:hypothetical protein
MLADITKAENAGDNAKAEKIRAEFDKDLQVIVNKFQKDLEAGKMAEAVKPPTSQTLKNAMMAELYPGIKLDRVGKLKQQAIIDVYRGIMVEEDEDDLIPDEEDEYEDEEVEMEGGADPAFPE